jgi:predicted acylesterase/phospholipase RssA
MNGEAPRRIAVALSGGGHRACVFALGALLYLREAGLGADVTSVASVSGGSLANATVGSRLDFTAPDAEVEKAVGEVGKRISALPVVLSGLPKRASAPPPASAGRHSRA